MTPLARTADPSVRVVAMPGVLPSSRRVEMTIAQGATIAEIVATALPGMPEIERSAVRVSIGGHEILPGSWRARPKAGTQVSIRVLPGNDTVRSALSILVMIAAFTIAPHLAPGLVVASGSMLTLEAATSLAVAATAVVGSPGAGFLAASRSPA